MKMSENQYIKGCEVDHHSRGSPNSKRLNRDMAYMVHWKYTIALSTYLPLLSLKLAIIYEQLVVNGFTCTTLPGLAIGCPLMLFVLGSLSLVKEPRPLNGTVNALILSAIVVKY